METVRGIANELAEMPMLVPVCGVLELTSIIGKQTDTFLDTLFVFKTTFNQKMLVALHEAAVADKLYTSQVTHAFAVAHFVLFMFRVPMASEQQVLTSKPEVLSAVH